MNFSISQTLYPRIYSLYLASYSVIHAENIPTPRSLSLVRGTCKALLVQQLRWQLTHLLIDFHDYPRKCNDVIELPNFISSQFLLQCEAVHQSPKR